MTRRIPNIAEGPELMALSRALHSGGYRDASRALALAVDASSVDAFLLPLRVNDGNETLSVELYSTGIAALSGSEPVATPNGCIRPRGPRRSGPPAKPAEERTRPYTVPLSASDLEALEALAQLRGQSARSLAREVLSSWLAAARLGDLGALDG